MVMTSSPPVESVKSSVYFPVHEHMADTDINTTYWATHGNTKFSVQLTSEGSLRPPIKDNSYLTGCGLHGHNLASFFPPQVNPRTKM